MPTRRHVFSLIFVIILAVIGVAEMTVLNARPKLGLDLTGGLSVILSAKGQTSAEVLDKTVGIIRDRVDSLGTTEPEISRAGDRNIIVQIPQVKDPDRALQIIGKTAQLRFRPVIAAVPAAQAKEQGWKLSEADPADREVTFAGENNTWFKLAPTAVRGDDVKDAFAELSSQNQWLVQLQLTRDGTAAFSEITKQLAPQQGGNGQRLAIVLDRRVESAPVVQSPIENGSAQISGTFKEQEAKDLALVLRTGALPIELEPQQVQKVSATLGSASLRAGLIAGLIGLSLVALYMLLFYRLLGLITLVGLGMFGAIVLGIIGLIGALRGFTLTLAGIAGLIVSVGIAADSYIVFFERIKDELKDGKTFRSAVERGFKSAFRTNVTANSVAFLGAIILYFMAIGPVRGFALMLGISVLVDIFLLYFYTYPVVALIARNRRVAGLRNVGMPEAVTQS